ncbi:hypothetical protein [Nonomuraea sp. NPDC005692]|uniref:hypothetical protein n=1 Tax=Nonomuraea sp. NPDC005692 TaxID=3157168 RepID=UPI0033E9038E
MVMISERPAEVHLPHDHTGLSMRDALLDSVARLPVHLRRSLTWDQGSEMGRRSEFSVAADMPVHFCDPAGPWQRGFNEDARLGHPSRAVGHAARRRG